MPCACRRRSRLRGICLYTRPTRTLAVAPALNGTIRSVRDLKGHTVGVSAPGSASHQILNFLLVSNGLSPDDVSTGLGRHVGQLGGRSRARQGGRGGFDCECDYMSKSDSPRSDFLRIRVHRTVRGGCSVQRSSLARVSWPKTTGSKSNDDTARAARRAVKRACNGCVIILRNRCAR